MDLLFHLLGVAAGITLLVAGFIYIVQPRQALALLKRVGMAVAALILGTALLQKIIADVPQVGGALVLMLLAASPVAYLIRRARMKKPRPQVNARGAERIPAGLHVPGDDV